jgi:SET domain-containing protein
VVTHTCWTSAKTAGGDSLGKGRGLFAVERIGQDEVVAIFGGRVIDGEELRRLPAEQRRLAFQVEETAYLLSEREGPGDWVNHSCEPNAGLRGQVVLVSRYPIEVGEEITFDYAMTDGSDYDEFGCCCGAGRCRGRVTGNDWMRPELQRRYREYFSPYLARRIRALR